MGPGEIPYPIRGGCRVAKAGDCFRFLSNIEECNSMLVRNLFPVIFWAPAFSPFFLQASSLSKF